MSIARVGDINIEYYVEGAGPPGGTGQAQARYAAITWGGTPYSRS